MSGALLLPPCAGAAAALLHLSAVAGLPGLLLAYFAQLPLAVAGFGLGFMPAAVAVAVAALVVGIASPGAGALSLFLIVSGLPVLLVVRLALRSREGPDGAVEWYPAGRLVAWLVALALAAFAAAVLLFAARDGGLSGAVAAHLGALAAGLPGLPEGAAAAVARYFPGFAAASWILMTVVNCAVALHLLAVSGRSLRPRPEYRALRSPAWPLAVAAAGAAMSLLGGDAADVGANAAIIACAAFFFSGLAVLHAVSANWPGRPLLLAAVYVLMPLLTWPAAAICALGAADNWLRLRPPPAGGRPNERSSPWK